MQSVVISPENIIDSMIPTVGEICLAFLESGELNVNIILALF